MEGKEGQREKSAKTEALLENYDRPTDLPTNQPTHRRKDRVIGKLQL